MKATRCSSKDCDRAPTESLYLRGQVGHVHDCTQHAALLREFCDVVGSHPLTDGECVAVPCTGDVWIWAGQPTPLDQR